MSRASICSTNTAAHKGVSFSRCGKLIVAVSQEEFGVLGTLKTRASANGVDDLEYLNAADVAALEPELRAVGALLSPSTATA